MRVLSDIAREAMFSQSSKEVMLKVLTLNLPSGVIRVVDDENEITSNGEVFEAFPFSLPLPEERDDRVSRVQLTITNIDARIMDGISQLVAPLPITMEVILASDPDTIEAGPFDFFMMSAKFDAKVVTGELAFEDVLHEAYPGWRVTPGSHPAAF